MSLSVNADVNTESWNTSSHRSKVKLLVMIVEARPARKDKCVKSSSTPSLSKEIYPNSSIITKSYFSNFNSNERNVLADLLSFNWFTSEATLVK